MAGPRLTRSDMLRLFDLLNAELAAMDAHGEIYLVGGAVMCLALDARHATRDVDGGPGLIPMLKSCTTSDAD